MASIAHKHTFAFDLKSIDVLRFNIERSYSNIISPFSRIYLVTKGSGWINILGKKHTLETGYLYLVPSFQPCSYFFSQDLEHYYVHFRVQLMNGLNAYHLLNTGNKVKALDLDHSLMKRLHALNPDLAIPHHDPKIYQTREWMYRNIKYRSISHYNENRGIIDQLFSRFIQDGHSASGSDVLRYNIISILEYIQKHLKEPISVNTLADKACLSRDHFTRVFKQITTLTPCEYIILQRVEQAQLLLLTTDYSINKIIEETGFRSLSYFSRTFKKHTEFSPNEFRNSKRINQNP